MSNKKSVADLDTQSPEPGIYIDVPDSKYFETKALNNSKLNTIINDSPAHAKLEADNPDYSSSKSQMLGTIAHAILLQPDQFEERVKMLPEGSARTNKWKNELVKRFDKAPLSTDYKKDDNIALIEEHYPDAVIADKGMIDLANSMVDRMREDDKRYYKGKLSTIMRDGYAEVMFVWKDKDTGLLCKCKFDWINLDIGLGFDYKTTKDANPNKFRYSVSDYGYHRQLAFYYRGANANGVELKKNAILAQEKQPPYLHAWYEFMFDADYLNSVKGNEFQVANYQVDGALRRYQYCRKNDYWPGYTNRMGDNVFAIALKYDDYKAYQEDPWMEDENEIKLDKLEELL